MTDSILAIDPGTKCGWCLRASDGSMDSGVWNLKGGRFEGGGMRSVRLAAHLNELYGMVPFTAVFYEEVRRHMGVDAAHIYGGIIAKISEWGELNGVPYAGVPVGTIKKFATGKGNADKSQMIAAAVAKWPTLAAKTGADEADARWIAECAATTKIW